MPDRFRIRSATPADVGVIAHHRASMFKDMGSVAPGNIARLMEMSRSSLQQSMESGLYLGWLASPSAEPNKIVAGAGVLVRRVLPFPLSGADGPADVAEGRQALVMNVYTEPAYRRQGAARTLMHEVLAWARGSRIESLVLHAAPDGRLLYEALGFVATNEMRYGADLAAWQRPDLS